MTSSRSFYVWILMLAIAVPSQVQAGSVTNTDGYVFNYLGAQGPNAVGVPTGLFLYVGGAFDPIAGTTVTATQGAISGDIPYNGSSRVDLFARGVQILPTTDLSQLTGSWTLTASNPALSPITVSTNAILPSVVSYFQAALGPGGGSLYSTPFGMSVSDLSTTPTISWFIHSAGGYSPSGTTYSPWSYIRSVSSPNILVNGDGTYFIHSCEEYLIFSGCSVVFHPFNLGFAPLALGNSYIIDTSSTFLLDPLLSSVQGTADSFFAFTPSKLQLTAGVPIFLPQETTEGSFLFDMPVIANNPVYLDPTVATGYDFQTGLGDPLFSSVEFPDLGAPNYSISLWDGSKYVFDALVAPNTQFFFPGGGVDRFRVGGIDPSLGLDPQDGTAFPAEVTFASNGSFTGTMTPLTENVPEPATLALLGLGLAGLGFSRRKQ